MRGRPPGCRLRQSDSHRRGLALGDQPHAPQLEQRLERIELAQLPGEHDGADVPPAVEFLIVDGSSAADRYANCDEYYSHSAYFTKIYSGMSVYGV